MHRPVLLKEVIELLNPQPGQIYVDATINGGGHAGAILQRIAPGGKILGIDRDDGLIEELKKRNRGNNNLILECGNFANIKNIAGKHNLDPIAGILFDLGFSLYHIESSGRGFSFAREEPLDMRYGKEEGIPTAEHIINTRREDELERIFREYGEEKFSRRIAKTIVAARVKNRIRTTSDLRKLIIKSIPAFRGRRDPSTRVFQALRIAVNKEFEYIAAGLEAAAELLAKGGRLAVISFHSLEDRMVKKFFKERENSGEFSIITDKPVTASEKEIKENPRARSAKLRVCAKESLSAN